MFSLQDALSDTKEKKNDASWHTLYDDGTSRAFQWQIILPSCL